MRLFLFVIIAFLFASCSPVEPVSRELPTKYSNVPTMGAAEDANTKEFNENSFNR